MRFFVYADLQATDGQETCFYHPGRTLQDYRVAKFFADARRIYEQYQCSGVIDLGDTTDDRSSIPVPTIEVIGTGLSNLPKGDWNFKLTGNHEQYLRNAEINNRRLFDHFFNVVDGCAVFEFDQYMAFFCSYTDDYSALADWLEEGVKEYRNYPKILFGHFPVVGARMPSGPALQGVPMEILKYFKLCLLGHVHLPQTMGGNVHYVGSPFQQHWGEAGEAKRVAIFDTEGCKVTWVPMIGYPEYHQVSLDEFKVASQHQSEDRFKVKLSSHAEAEMFFAHPKFHQAEPVYTYEEGLPEESEDKGDWSFESVAQRYLGLVPPQAAGIEVSPEELMQVGQMIVSGDI